jgi:glycerate dehydrogenase
MKGVILEAGAVSTGDVPWSPVTDIMPFKIYDNTTEENKYDHIQDDTEFVLTNKVKMDEALFQHFPKIKYIGVCATGYNVVDLAAARDHGITVTNVPAYSTESVMQLTLAFILSLASGVPEHVKDVNAGGWTRSDKFCYWLTPIMELSGKTLGIFGYGNIGKRVAEAAMVFGMNVLVHTAHPDKYLKDRIPGRLIFTDADTLYAQADIITYHCPLNSKTEHIINKENISKMKDGVIIINVSRGGLVNEADLKEALLSGKVWKAGLDVVEEEPMRKDNPLLGIDNIYITPHIAWASIEARTRLVNTIADNIKGFINGRPVNVVN